MEIQYRRLVATAGCCLLLASCALFGEQDIPLADVPAPVMKAARTAVDVITITSAAVETEDGETVYELDGSADGVDYEVEVSADGNVLEVEADD